MLPQACRNGSKCSYLVDSKAIIGRAASPMPIFGKAADPGRRGIAGRKKTQLLFVIHVAEP